MKFNLPIALIGSVPELEQELERRGQATTHFKGKRLTSQQLAKVSGVVFASGHAGQSGHSDSVSNAVATLRRRNETLPLFTVGGAGAKFFSALADDIVTAAKTYVESLTPPFFKALLKYAESGADSWHCPGHSGGAAFLKSPQGQLFHQYFGENMLRADVCNAVEELGQLLEHTGAVADAEQNAARIFGADHLYFVTNGTSTSNKIVWNSLVGRDDIVIVDRNCHKSNLHAIIMTGAIPVFLEPTRNQYGIIGPIPESEFKWENIQKKIEANPFIKDKKKKPRLLTLTQSTYDGILYNAERIKKELDGKVDAFHFDEAWLPHAAFHPIYKNMHAIGKERSRTHQSMLYATQSTHKTLAGLSQASQILVQESESKKLNRAVFNEAYLMHTSTSPQYTIIASCDVAAAMMDGCGGRALVDDSLHEAADFRKTMREIGDVNDWWFKVWGPTSRERSEGAQAQWLLRADDNWHGFGQIASGFNMLDPIKVTILTPGLKEDGSFGSNGIPASIVAKYLCENGVIVEKCGLYSFFIMFTIGVTSGRWRTLIAALERFKQAYDRNESVGAVMPHFAAKHVEYATCGLRDLCQKIHSSFRGHDIARLTSGMYLQEAEAAILPSTSFAMTAHEEVDRVPIENLEGKITAVLLTPYPPGIPLLLPGERFTRAIIDYLKFAAEFNRQFPGFETDVHGLVSVDVGGVKTYAVDCLREKKAKVRSAIRAVS